MDLALDILPNECLLCIFDYINPIDWIEISRVNPRWKLILERKWRLLSEISTYDDDDYGVNRASPNVITNILPMELDDLIENAGPFIRSIKLRNHWNYAHKLLIQIGPYYYYTKRFEPIEYIITSLAKSCKNIKNIELTRVSMVRYLSLRDLLHSNQNVKTVSLYKSNLNDALEEINDQNNVVECFPKMKKLMLTIEARIFSEADQIINRILSRGRELKSLSLVIKISRPIEKKHDRKGLSNVADDVGLPLLEKLRVSIRPLETPKELMTFEDGVVTKMLAVSRNLRVIKLDNIELGDASADDFLALPKLQELSINHVKKFACQLVMPLNHLISLTLKFDPNASLDCPSLCRAIQRMPVLIKLEVLGLSEQNSLDLTCTAVRKGIEERKFVVIDARSTNDAVLEISKNDSSKQKTEKTYLNLLIGEQSKFYCDNIIKFVNESLEECLLSKFKELNQRKREEGLDSSTSTLDTDISIKSRPEVINDKVDHNMAL